MRNFVGALVVVVLLVASAGVARAEVVSSSSWHSDTGMSNVTLSYGGNSSPPTPIAYAAYTIPNSVVYGALGVYGGFPFFTFRLDAEFSSAYNLPALYVRYGSNIGSFTVLSTISVSEDSGVSWHALAVNQYIAGYSYSTVAYDISAIAYANRDAVNQVRFEFFTDLNTGDQVEITGIQGESIPEPATLALFGLGLLGVGGVLRRRARLARQRTQS